MRRGSDGSFVHASLMFKTLGVKKALRFPRNPPIKGNFQAFPYSDYKKLNYNFWRTAPNFQKKFLVPNKL